MALDDDPDLYPPNDGFDPATFAEDDEATAASSAERPPVLSTAHLFVWHRRWLATFFPSPRPPGGWPTAPDFRAWVEAQGVPYYREL